MDSTAKLRVADSAADVIRGLHPRLKQKIRAAFDVLVRDPYAGIGLRQELSGLWRYRVGRFRIVYRIAAQRVEVVAIGPRDRIYEETYRLVRAESP